MTACSPKAKTLFDWNKPKQLLVEKLQSKSLELSLNKKDDGVFKQRAQSGLITTCTVNLHMVLHFESNI